MILENITETELNNLPDDDLLLFYKLDKREREIRRIREETLELIRAQGDKKMKAYEEWREKEADATPRAHPGDDHYPWRDRDMWAEDAWRAALERALKAGQEAGLEDFIPVSWIKEELAS